MEIKKTDRYTCTSEKQQGSKEYKIQELIFKNDYHRRFVETRKSDTKKRRDLTDLSEHWHQIGKRITGGRRLTRRPRPMPCIETRFSSRWLDIIDACWETSLIPRPVIMYCSSSSVVFVRNEGEVGQRQSIRMGDSNRGLVLTSTD